MFGEIAHRMRSVPLTYGEVALAASYSITASVGTWVDTGFGLNIPFAGAYLIMVSIRGYVQIGDSANLSLQIKLYQDDLAADVPNSNRFFILADTSTNAALVNEDVQASTTFSFIVTFVAACRLRLYARRNGSSTSITASQIVTDANGGSAMAYIRIG